MRPEIFSFLFTSLTLFILERYQRNKTRLIYLLPLISLIWVNTHIYFFMGLAIQGIYILARFNRQLLKTLKNDKVFRIQLLVLILSGIVKDPDWKTVFLDHFVIVLVKKDYVEKSDLQELDLDKMDPSTSRFGDYYQNISLAAFLYNTGHLIPAEKFALRAYQQAPNRPEVNVFLLGLLKAKGEVLNSSNAYYQNSSNLVFW